MEGRGLNARWRGGGAMLDAEARAVDEGVSAGAPGSERDESQSLANLINE